MDILKLIINILLVVCSLILILVVLFQKGKSGGLSAAFGGAAVENFFGKNKVKSIEGKLALWTKILGGAIAVFCVTLVVLFRV